MAASSPQWALPPPLAARPRLTLVLLCLLLWLPGFFTLPPTDRDESRFVQATRQMLDSGDYVRIMNGSVPRLKKPIGIYWAQAPFAAAARKAGLARQNPVWPYRLPSLLGALAAVLATRALAMALGASAATGFGAAAMLAASVVLTVEAHIAKTDAALLGCITICLWLWAQARHAALSRIAAGGFWVALAAAVLLKGPIGPMVLGLATACLAAWPEERAALARLRPVSGIAILLALVLPWFIAIMLATRGGFLAEAAGHDLGGKLAGGQEGHGAPFGLHLALLPLLFFPATVPLLRGLRLAAQARAEPAMRFLLCVILPSWLVFEIVPTKLPHYTLPLYPALAVLAAMGVARGTSAPRPWRQAGWALLCVAGLAGVAAAYLHGPQAGLPGGLAAVLAAILVLILALAMLLGAEMPLTGVALGGAVYAAVLGIALPQLTPLWIAPRLTAAFDAALPGRAADGAGLATVGFAEPSLMFLAGSRISFEPDADPAAAGLAAGRYQAVAVEGRAEAAFLADCAQRGVKLAAHAPVQGLNYANGKRVRLSVYTAAP